MSTKSLSEYVLGLYGAMLNDVAQEYPALQLEFSRDYKRLRSAIEEHGIQFTLITMPSYRKHFDKCLDNGSLTRAGMIHFGSFKQVSPVPRLFKGLMLRIFDELGVLRSDPDVRAIFWIRQLLGAVRKLKMDCPNSATWEQVDAFFKTDAAIRSPSTNWDDPDEWSDNLRHLSLRDAGIYHDRCSSISPKEELFGDTIARTFSHSALFFADDTIQTVADIVVGQFGRFEPLDWMARHGPGAVADHKGGYKYDFPNWPAKLQAIFPYDQFGVSSLNALSEDCLASCAQKPHFERSESGARIIAVPKSLKAPRLIAAEPVAHQWCQQIVRNFLMTRGTTELIGLFVNYRRQDLSGEMVLQASIDGNLATMDLSEASDRLSCWLVERIFRSNPSLVNAFKAVRTRWATQDLDRLRLKAFHLKKFSTMGSALTFPVQSIVFAVFAIGCTLQSSGLKPTIANIRRLRGSVRVFGDDIIVPKHALELLGNTLEAHGLKVNAAKTFGVGKFRESCGVDAYGGHDVTTININEFPRKSAPGAVTSCIDVHNNLFEANMFHTAAFVRKTVERLGFKIPEVRPSSGDFGWNSFTWFEDNRFKTRWNSALHRSERRIHTPQGVVDRRLPEGYPGLLQFFTEAPRVVQSAYSTIGYLVGRAKNKLVLRWAARP